MDHACCLLLWPCFSSTKGRVKGLLRIFSQLDNYGNPVRKNEIKPLLLSKPFAHLTFRHMQDHGVARLQVGGGHSFLIRGGGASELCYVYLGPARQKVRSVWVNECNAEARMYKNLPGHSKLTKEAWPKGFLSWLSFCIHYMGWVSSSRSSWMGDLDTWNHQSRISGLEGSRDMSGPL